MSIGPVFILIYKTEIALTAGDIPGFAYKPYRYVNAQKILNREENLSRISVSFLRLLSSFMPAWRCLPPDFPQAPSLCFYSRVGGSGYQGHKFKVHLCGTGDMTGEYVPDGNQTQVFNESDLVALRLLKLIVNNFDRGIEYHPTISLY